MWHGLLVCLLTARFYTLVLALWRVFGLLLVTMINTMYRSARSKNHDRHVGILLKVICCPAVLAVYGHLR